MRAHRDACFALSSIDFAVNTLGLPSPPLTMMLLLLALRAQTQTDDVNKEAEQALPTNHENPVQIYKA